jgi:hypothetical protein
VFNKNLLFSLLFLTTLISLSISTGCATTSGDVYKTGSFTLENCRIGILSLNGYNISQAEDEVSFHILKAGGIPIEGSNINKIIAEQNFQLSDFVDNDTAVKIGKLIGAKFVIMGSTSEPRFENVANFSDNTWQTCSLTFTARIVDVESAKIIVSGRANASRGYADRALSDAIAKFFYDIK